MAGHSTLHPYLKSYDELKRTISRMNNYMSMFGTTMSNEELLSINKMIDHLEAAVELIPEEFQVSRYKQFNKKD